MLWFLCCFLCTVKDVMYICPFSGLINGTLTITDYKLYFTSVEQVQQNSGSCHTQPAFMYLRTAVRPQESQFILDISLGAISRLETISVPNLGENTKGLELVCKVSWFFRSFRFSVFAIGCHFVDGVGVPSSDRQDMRSPRFAYKTESSQPDIIEVLSRHAFPLCHNLVSLMQNMLFD